MRRAHPAAVAALLVVVLTASACAARPAAPALTAPASAPASKTIWVVGDSLTVQSRDQLRTRLQADGWAVSGIDAIGGKTTSWVAERARSTFSGKTPPYVVIATGTNDTEDYGTEAARAADLINWFTARGTQRVYWVNVHRDERDQVNQALGDLAAQPGAPLTLIDWQTAATGHPAWLVSDGVHLTEAGAQARADLIAAAVAVAGH